MLKEFLDQQRQWQGYTTYTQTVRLHPSLPEGIQAVFMEEVALLLRLSSLPLCIHPLDGPNHTQVIVCMDPAGPPCPPSSGSAKPHLLSPQVGNLGLLFMLLFFIYAALGVELFGKLGE